MPSPEYHTQPVVARDTQHILREQVYIIYIRDEYQKASRHAHHIDTCRHHIQTYTQLHGAAAQRLMEHDEDHYISQHITTHNIGYIRRDRHIYFFRKKSLRYERAITSYTHRQLQHYHNLEDISTHALCGEPLPAEERFCFYIIVVVITHTYTLLLRYYWRAPYITHAAAEKNMFIHHTPLRI